MLELTHDNYLSWNYGREDFGFRESASDKLTIRYRPVNLRCGNFFEECLRAARFVADRADKPIWVAYSGGADSEVCLLSFLKAGLEPIAATIRFAHGHNSADVDAATKFCRNHGVRHEVFDLDVELFWNDHLLEYAQPVQSVSPQFPVTFWLLDQIEGFPVVASGDSFLMRESGTRTMYFYEQEKYLSYYRHLLRRGRAGVPAFFQYTPQLVLAYMRDESLQEFVAKDAQRRKMLSAKHFKCEVYRRYFDLDYRLALNGFESLQLADNFHRTFLAQRFPGADSFLKLEVEHFVETLENLCHKGAPAEFSFTSQTSFKN